MPSLSQEALCFRTLFIAELDDVSGPKIISDKNIKIITVKHHIEEMKKIQGEIKSLVEKGKRLEERRFSPFFPELLLSWQVSWGAQTV